MTPSVGRIILVLVDPTKNNGSEIAPAIITRVWSETPNGWCVNYKIFYDGVTIPGYASSAYLVADEQAARENETAMRGTRAFWPPRV
jgi:hypothetical protein